MCGRVKEPIFSYFTLSVFSSEMKMITYIVFLNRLQNTCFVLCDLLYKVVPTR